MNKGWTGEFRNRMEQYRAANPGASDMVEASVKIRVSSGCFHREHSPQAYPLIDKAVAKAKKQAPLIHLEEHESGPEILVYMTLTAAGLQFAKSIIDLIVAILRARSEGIRKGDSPRDPLKLILRRTNKTGDCVEEEVLTVESTDSIVEVEIEEALTKAGEALLKKTK
ncbi:MAG: hypothetical protein WCL49_12910 [bacterium]